jgi:sugar phosphate permease
MSTVSSTLVNTRTAPGTAARWTPTLTMWLVSLVSYIDRNTLALLAPAILRETGLSGEQYGFIISGFHRLYDR